MTAGLAFEGMNHAGVADTDLLIILNDNGIGIDKLALRREKHRLGLGLEGMAERARIINAELRVESSPGNGTTVKITIPYRKPSGNVDKFGDNDTIE